MRYSSSLPVNSALIILALYAFNVSAETGSDGFSVSTTLLSTVAPGVNGLSSPSSLVAEVAEEEEVWRGVETDGRGLLSRDGAAEEAGDREEADVGCLNRAEAEAADDDDDVL